MYYDAEQHYLFDIYVFNIFFITLQGPAVSPPVIISVNQKDVTAPLVVNVTPPAKPADYNGDWKPVSMA